MIDAEARTEYPFQPFGDLCSQCYFRQQIQHLFPLPDDLLYQMNVNLSLSTGCNSMQQANIFSPETIHDLIVCTLLMSIQGIQGECVSGKSCIQSANLLLIDLKNSPFHQSVKYGRSSGSPLQKFFLRYLLLHLSQTAG